MNRTKLPDFDTASTIALSALTFLAQNTERLAQFMAATGVDVDTLRQHAQSASLQASVLDYLLRDESLLLTFTANAGLAPGTIEPALHVLQNSQ